MSVAKNWLLTLLCHLDDTSQRGLLRLAGNQDWAYEWLQSSGLNAHNKNVVWFTEPDRLKSSSIRDKNEWRLKHYKRYLGQECQFLVLDAFQGFNVDAFAALSGLIKEGGLLILVTPPDNKWLTYPDPEVDRFTPAGYSFSSFINETQPSRFIQNLLHNFELSNGYYFIEESSESEGIKSVKALQNLPILQDSDSHPASHINANVSINKTSSEILAKRQATDYKTFDQKVAGQKMAALWENAFYSADNNISDRNTIITNDSISNKSKSNVLVLSADRGRGKSSVIGIALAKWLNAFVNKSANKLLNLVVTAPHESSVSTLLSHYSVHKNIEAINHAPDLRFLAPDQIITRNEPIDILIIDEAAAIPVPLVQHLVKLSKTCVLATTAHGYEGTGRGFEYKLLPWLKSHLGHFEMLKMEQPIRWQPGDELESLINQGLHLTADLAGCVPKTINMNAINFSKLDRDSLSNDVIDAIFSLLAHAHYKTTPNDLRMLLDAPNIDVLVLESAGDVVATALISKEGQLHKLGDSLCDHIWQGRRRPKGHLATQSLIAHAGYKEAGNYSYARVVRIAVHPNLQSQGLGNQLLSNVFEYYHDIDFMCTSYGVDTRLVSFWTDNYYVPVRLGLKAETSTGEYSVLMVRPKSEKAKALSKQWNVRFYETLQTEQQLNVRPLFDDGILTSRTNQYKPKDDSKDYNQAYKKWCDAQNRQDVECFANYFRSPDSCSLALSAFLTIVSQDKDRAIKFSKELELLQDKFLQGLNNKALIDKYKFSGEKALVQQLRASVKHCFV